MKRLLSVFLVVCLAMTMCSVCAAAQGNEVEVSIPILSVDENATESEIVDIINATVEEGVNEDEVGTPTPRGYIDIRPFLIRSGNTSSCELYFRWTCPGYLCSAFSFDLLQLHNGSALFPEIYSNIGGSYIPCETGSSGSVRVRGVTIPVSVSTVYATSQNVKAQILSYGWISTLSLTGVVPFN